MIDPYQAYILLGIAVGTGLFAVAWQRAGLRLDWRLAAFCLATIVSGLIGARGYMAIEQWRNGVVQPGWLDGGFRLPGGVLGLLIGLVIWRHVFLPRVTLARIADLGAMTVPFGLAVMRFGCLAAGCCFGTVSSLPWAMRYPLGTPAATLHEEMHLIGRGDLFSLPVHPLPVYFMLLQLAVGSALVWFRRRQSYDGQLVLLGLLLGQGGKALLEIFRQPIPSAPALHLGAIGAVIAAAATLTLVTLSMARAEGRGSDSPVSIASPESELTAAKNGRTGATPRKRGS